MTAMRGIGNLPLADRLEQAANTVAMTDLRAKPEVARSRCDIERPALDLWLSAVDLEVYRPAGGGCGSGDVIGRDPFRVCDEVAQLLAAFCIAGLRRRTCGIVNIDVGPVRHWGHARGLARKRRADNLLDRKSGFPSRSVNHGEAQRAEIE